MLFPKESSLGADCSELRPLQLSKPRPLQLSKPCPLKLCSQPKLDSLPFQAPLVLSPLVTQLRPELGHLALESPAAANMSL